jgi:CDP-diglyceride synthetase
VEKRGGAPARGALNLHQSGERPFGRMEMADAITGAIGAIIMIAYMWLIVDKLNELPLWIVTIIGLVLMLWAFWGDDWKPIFKRNSK